MNSAALSGSAALTTLASRLYSERTVTRTTDAIFSNGVLRPLEPLPLREYERVRITVESVEQNGAARSTGRQRLIRGFDQLRLRTDGNPPSREELHERR